MKNYELLIILNGSLEAEKHEALTAKITGFLEKANATITKVDKWGIKKLAYPINYKTDGYYIIFNLEAPADLVSVVEPRLRIEEDIVRVLFTAK